MQRRTFLKACAAVGLSLSSTTLLTREAQAAYEGYVYIFVNARGGWCATSIMDPKGNVNGIDSYDTGSIGTVAGSPITYAPMPGMQQFFDTNARRMLVLNGIDYETNGHESGQRGAFTGKIQEGNPALPALIAAKVGPALPLAFITNGGQDNTEGIIAATRASNVDIIPKIAYSNRLNPDNEAGFHSPSALAKIRAASDERLLLLKNRSKLSKMRNNIGMLATSRLGEAELKDVLQYIPDNPGNGIDGQASVALAAFRAGLGVSATVQMGGFDTHNDHDNRAGQRNQMLVEGIDAIWTQAEQLGVSDKLVMVVGSDFSRTPRYNGNNGKDHWPIGSMMIITEPGKGIPVNKVIGGTDEGTRPMMINPQTLAFDEAGVRLKLPHIHGALRKFAGINKDAFSLQFPLDENALPILDQ